MEVMEDVRPFALMIEECRELYAILTTPHLRVRLTRQSLGTNLVPLELGQFWDSLRLFGTPSALKFKNIFLKSCIVGHVTSKGYGE